MEEGNSVGRPTVMTPENIEKLESIFKIGGTISEACSYAGIGETTYYDHSREDENFRRKMEASQHYPDIVAKNIVIDKIVKEKSIADAWRWLENREFRKDSAIGMRKDKEGNIEVVIKRI